MISENISPLKSYLFQNTRVSEILKNDLKNTVAFPRKIPRHIRERIARILVEDIVEEKPYQIKDKNAFISDNGAFYHLFLAIRNSKEWNSLRDLYRKSEVGGIILLKEVIPLIFSILDDFHTHRETIQKDLDDSILKILEKFDDLLEKTKNRWEKGDNPNENHPDNHLNQIGFEEELFEILQSLQAQLREIREDRECGPFFGDSVKQNYELLNNLLNTVDLQNLANLPGSTYDDLIEFQKMIDEWVHQSLIGQQKQQKELIRDQENNRSILDAEKEIENNKEENKEGRESEGRESEGRESEDGKEGKGEEFKKERGETIGRGDIEGLNKKDLSKDTPNSEKNDPNSLKEKTPKIDEINEKIEKILDSLKQTLQENNDPLVREINSFESIKGSQSKLNSAIQAVFSGEMTHNFEKIEQQLEILEVLSLLYGSNFSHEIQALHETYLRNLEKYSEIFERNEDLKQIVKCIGRIELEYGAKNIRVSPHGKSDLHSVHLSNEISRVLPSELVKIGHPVLKKVFYSNLIDGKLVSYQLRGKNWVSGPPKKKEKGPVVAMVDTSGSMNGAPEIISKAIILAISKKMLKESRDVKVILFSSVGQFEEIELTAKKRSAKEFIEFLNMRFGGGTDFNTALEQGIKSLEDEEFKGADLLFITDGLSSLTKRDVLERCGEIKKENNMKIYTLIIGNGSSGGLEEVSDHTYFVEANYEWDYRKSPAKIVKQISRRITAKSYAEAKIST